MLHSHLDLETSIRQFDKSQTETALCESILQKLNEAGGVLRLSDKSPAEEIAHYFQCSKKSFKKAIGALYKARRIVIEENSIRKS